MTAGEPVAAVGGGGVAPRPLRRLPPGDLGPEDGGAGALAPLLLRGVAALALVWLLVWWLPVLPDAVAVLAVLGFGAVVALPQAWAGAVRRGHDLRVMAEGAALRSLMAGALLRVGLAGIAGVGAAALAVLRLSEAGLAFWALAALALPLTWGLMAALAPRAAAQAAGLHARRMVHLWARLGASGLLLGAASLAGLVLPVAPAPLEGVPVAAPLVAEAQAAARLWAGFEAYALGQAAEFGAWGRGTALAVAAGALAGVFWALTGLAVALALPRAEWRRALAPASDGPEAPPAGRAGPVAAGVLAVAVLGGAIAAGSWLGARPPEARPVARAQIAAEVIGEALHVAGTAERLAALRAAALAQDAEGQAEVLAALDAGFDAMAANVEGFLDDYYSLIGEYERLWQWVWGGLEDHLTTQMQATLQAGAPFAAYEQALALAVAATEARAAELARAEAALLTASRIDGVNPARLRVVGRHAPLPLREVRLAGDLAAAQGRWIVSAGTGVVAAAVAQRVVAGLAARGLLGTAARIALRAGGVLVALGVDAALVELDEYLNRDTFRAEILADIEAQRQAARAALTATLP